MVECTGLRRPERRAPQTHQGDEGVGHAAGDREEETEREGGEGAESGAGRQEEEEEAEFALGQREGATDEETEKVSAVVVILDPKKSNDVSLVQKLFPMSY